MVAIQPIIDPYQESLMENLGKSALQHCMFALLTNVWGTVNILYPKILMHQCSKSDKQITTGTNFSTLFNKIVSSS